MQSLHAFLNIQQHLRKNQKSEALVLSLENNFVTPLTSLVVVKPGEEDSLLGVKEVEEENYESSLQLRGGYSYDYSYHSYLMSAPQYDDYYDAGQDWMGSVLAMDLEVTTSDIGDIPAAVTPASPSCAGSRLVLYSSTYHRGEQLTLLDDSSDLSTMDDRAVSAIVSGSCCWLLYADRDFQGESYRLSPGGDYRTTNSFGRNLFRDVSSVRMIPC